MESMTNRSVAGVVHSHCFRHQELQFGAGQWLYFLMTEAVTVNSLPGVII